jgi:hypothetical protein
MNAEEQQLSTSFCSLGLRRKPLQQGLVRGGGGGGGGGEGVDASQPLLLTEEPATTLLGRFFRYFLLAVAAGAAAGAGAGAAALVAVARGPPARTNARSLGGVEQVPHLLHKRELAHRGTSDDGVALSFSLSLSLSLFLSISVAAARRRRRKWSVRMKAMFEITLVLLDCCTESLVAAVRVFLANLGVVGIGVRGLEYTWKRRNEGEQN